jgi:tetratricopeptide (TPR) repeat protein
VRRFNRGIFSYIPGQPLEDYVLYFDHAPNTGYDDKFEFVSVAYRLRKSRCFLESKGALTCLSCHDPHRKLPAGEEATSYYSGQCRHCHEPGISTLVAQGKHPDEADCVSCHMPKRRTEDVVHALITDHFIQRKVPMRDLQAELQERQLTDAEEYHGEVVPYYPSPLPKTSENSRYLAVAQVARQNNLKKGVADLAREISQHPREEEFYIALGDAWKNIGNSKAAVGAFEQAVRLKPKSVTALRSLAASLKTSGNVSRSEQILNRALDLAPLHGSTWSQYALLEADLGRTDRAIEKLQKALALNPDLPEGDLNLATLFVREAQMEPAEIALKRALSIDPYDAAAYDLMGRVLAGKKNEMSMALYSFQKATHLRPDYGPYLYNYALALVAAQRLGEARTQAQAAVNADPNLAEGHVLLGGLLARDQRLAEAVSEYQQAVKLQPGLSLVHLDLGLILAAQGDLRSATEHLRKAAAARDPNVVRQAAQALQRISNH